MISLPRLLASGIEGSVRHWKWLGSFEVALRLERRAGILPIGFKSNQKLIEAPQAEEEDEKE